MFDLILTVDKLRKPLKTIGIDGLILRNLN